MKLLLLKCNMTINLGLTTYTTDKEVIGLIGV